LVSRHPTYNLFASDFLGKDFIMPGQKETPLLDMVVKRISEEVASVLKVDPGNVEEHLGEY